MILINHDSWHDIVYNIVYRHLFASHHSFFLNAINCFTWRETCVHVFSTCIPPYGRIRIRFIFHGTRSYSSKNKNTSKLVQLQIVTVFRRDFCLFSSFIRHSCYPGVLALYLPCCALLCLVSTQTCIQTIHTHRRGIQNRYIILIIISSSSSSWW